MSGRKLALSIAAVWVATASSARAQAPPPDPAPAPAEPPPAAAPAPAPPPPAAGQPPPAPAYPPPGSYAYPPGYAPPPPGYYPGYPPPAYPPGPGMYVQTPPPAPAGPPPGHHLHDGFYLRMSLGGSYQKTDVETEGGTSWQVDGGGPGLDVLFGGTPTPGLVIGGGIFFAAAADPEIEQGGETTSFDGVGSLGLVGPFIDGFPDSEGGFHVGGAIGVATFGLKEEGAPDDEAVKFEGGGLALIAGYDAFVSSDWSVGGYVRLMGAKGEREETVAGETFTETATTGSFAVLFTALYH